METTDNFENFEASYKIVDGKKVLVVKTKAEQIVHPDGRKDVIIHAPSLKMINEFVEKNK